MDPALRETRKILRVNAIISGIGYRPKRIGLQRAMAVKLQYIFSYIALCYVE